MNAGYVVAVIAAMAAVTFLLRALPFVASAWLKRYPLVQRVSRFLPLAIMTLLLLHSGAGMAAEHRGGPWPEAAAAGLTILLQWRLRNALLSMFLGTAAYLALRNLLY